ncbi:MAG: bifunctional DNA primase/polymerase, partial [Anaerolineaceae bacterium]|nr:bifunctional DNA primase/polymerase [Anaerolineaceae bacterium]
MDEQLLTYRKLSEPYSLVRLKGKQPIERNWTQYCDRKRSFDEIGFQPGDNAGIACGPASNLLVVDVDNPDLFIKTCQRQGWTTPQTRTIETGSGKQHYYFRYPGNNKAYGNKARQSEGFDVRGYGGIIVAPGSLHPDTGKPYKIVNDIHDADPPQWLLG